MPINRLYHIWFGRILQLYPGLRVTQQRNLTWMLVGIYRSRSVQLHRIASKIPGMAKLTSVVARLMRFVNNHALDVRALYEPIARDWLEFQARTTGRIRLVMDASKVSSAHQLLMVAILFRRRAVPLVWTWIGSAKGHSSARKQLALLAYVRKLIPARVSVILIGDTEFEAGEVQQQLDQWRWKYTLRQKSSNQVQLVESEPWQPFRGLITQPGQSIWMDEVLLTRKHALPVNLLAHWAQGEKEPWLLATNLPSRQQALKSYRRRMWIEEMFGDMKRHGFDLESSHLHHFLRLSRLTLMVALLYVWLVTTAVRVIKSGLRSLVDRKDRRDLSIFQIGLRFTERRLTNSLLLVIHLRPAPLEQSVR